MAVDGGAGDTELRSYLGHRVPAPAILPGLVIHLPRDPGLPRGELRLLPATAAAGPGGGQARLGCARTSGRVLDYVDRLVVSSERRWDMDVCVGDHYDVRARLDRI